MLVVVKAARGRHIGHPNNTLVLSLAEMMAFFVGQIALTVERFERAAISSAIFSFQLSALCHEHASCWALVCSYIRGGLKVLIRVLVFTILLQ